MHLWREDRGYRQQTGGPEVRALSPTQAGLRALLSQVHNLRAYREGISRMAPWAAIVVADGTVRVYVHNWISAGEAKTPQELWDLVQNAWSTPEKYWALFYEALGRQSRPAVDPALANLSLEDLGI